MAPAWRSTRTHEVDAVVVGLEVVTRKCLVRDLLEVGRHQRDVERAPPQPREVEQVADQALQPVRLALEHLAGPLRRDDAVGERLRVPADRGERRLQLVTDGEEELPLRVLGAVELLRQLVERRRELTQLRRALDRERVRALTLREPPARLRHLRDRPGDGPREEQGHDRGQDGAHERGDREPREEWLPVRGLVARRTEEHDGVTVAEARGEHERIALHVDGAVCAPLRAAASQRLPPVGAARPAPA